jgi:hypothetical protein
MVTCVKGCSFSAISLTLYPCEEALRLGFCATLFDPVHDIVVFVAVAVAVGPFANSIGHFLRA